MLILCNYTATRRGNFLQYTHTKDQIYLFVTVPLSVIKMSFSEDINQYYFN